jgi:branched-chain amino acid transport system ATP-binding protein
MIRIENLCVNYGAVKALRDVSLQASPGQITAVLGANGAGKTTLLRAISGLVTVQSGTIHLGERSLVKMATENIARLGVGHVPEGRGVIGELTVEENLRLGALASKVNIAEGSKPSTGSSRSWATGARNTARRSRAGSARCWPWPAR